MQTLTRFLVAIAFALFLSDCRRVPELRPRLILQGENVGGQFWLDAPNVVVAKITRADLQGPLEPLFKGGPETLQLVKFEAAVENQLKGDLKDKTISFFFYAKVDQNPRYYLDPGKRYIVSLRKEGGALRSWADAMQLNLQVLSGYHNQQDIPLDQGLEDAIAYILLTPGTDCDLEAFRNWLTWPRYGSPGRVYERLTQLEANPNGLLSDSACITSASIFWHRPKCLERAARSPNANIHTAAIGFLEDDAKLPERLRSNPFFLSDQEWAEYSFQMLEIWTTDMRPEVKRAACAYLRSFAPGRIVEQCKKV